MKDGIRFHPRSPYAKICADVIVMNKNTIAPHAHTIPKPTSSVGEQSALPSPPGSFGAAQQSSLTDWGGIFLPRKVATFFNTFFTTGFTTFNKRSARGFASSAEDVATTAIDAVVVTIPADGMFETIWSGIESVSNHRRHSFPTCSYATIFLLPSTIFPTGSFNCCALVGHSGMVSYSLVLLELGADGASGFVVVYIGGAGGALSQVLICLYHNQER